MPAATSASVAGWMGDLSFMKVGDSGGAGGAHMAFTISTRAFVPSNHSYIKGEDPPLDGGGRTLKVAQLGRP